VHYKWLGLDIIMMNVTLSSGPKGPMGATGVTGVLGREGPTGLRGQQGWSGSTGAPGQYATGPVGPGPQGYPGSTGVWGDFGYGKVSFCCHMPPNWLVAVRSLCKYFCSLHQVIRLSSRQNINKYMYVYLCLSVHYLHMAHDESVRR